MEHYLIPRKARMDHLVNERVSRLAPYAGITLTVCLVVIFLVRYYVFEGFLMRKLYGKKYTEMVELVRRGFVNHHVAGAIKITLLGVAVYPFAVVAFGRSTLHTPLTPGGRITMGDALVCCSQLFIGMYVFELFYRSKVSPVSALHHMGAIVIAQSAITLSLDVSHQQDATIEFVLCFVWGAFDVIAEFLPHLAIVLYRLYPTEHDFLAKVFQASFFTEVVSTTTETAVVMWLFGCLWHRWTLPFKIITPVLHVLFSIAQIWGAVIFRRMWKQQIKLRDEAEKGNSAETSSVEAV